MEGYEEMGLFCKNVKRRRGGRSPVLCCAAAAFGFGLLLGLVCSLRLAVICAALLLIVMGISMLRTRR